MIRVVPVVVVSLALAAASVAMSAGTASGIRGTVVEGPTMPVCRQGVPCNAPAAGYALVFLRSGLRVATATTTGAGTFRVALKPGVYVVRSLRKSRFGSLAPRTVRVVSGRFTVVGFDVDTGIR